MHFPTPPHPLQKNPFKPSDHDVSLIHEQAETVSELWGKTDAIKLLLQNIKITFAFNFGIIIILIADLLPRMYLVRSQSPPPN